MSNHSTSLTMPDPAAAHGAIPRPPADFRTPVRVGMAVIGIALGGFGLWAATAPLDSAVVAQGMVTVESKRKLVQHREGGIVARLMVKEGDTVAAGAVLVRLQDAGAEAQLAVLSSQRDAKLAEQARLIAERDGLSAIDFPAALTDRGDDPKVIEAITRETDRFDERRKSLNGQLSILESRIAQLQAQRDGRDKLKDANRKQASLLQDELVGLRQLEAEGFYPKNRLRANERELARLQGEMYSDQAGTTQVDKEIGEAKLQVIQTTQKFREEVVADLAKIENDLNDIGQKLAAARDAVERLRVVAPVAGIVQSLKVAGPGAVVPPGGEVADIVPAADRLVVEAQVNPRDIDRVRDGQPARLRFTAFGARTTPEIGGAVTMVSADRFTDQGSRQGYYTARVEVPRDQVARLPGALKAGMPVEVMLEGGERTPLEYLLKPLGDSFARAFKER
ncbi:MAG: HlyD family type I secretion periplasmic adaptor subunit [Magnetospirillum sp.]|nr:HlyD family type I secretion periplasmic adaptor subunit [Magnetospirillum sp.]